LSHILPWNIETASHARRTGKNPRDFPKGGDFLHLGRETGQL
jgi:hypothetical protein